MECVPRQDIAAAAGNALGRNSALQGPLRDLADRHHRRSRPQHMVVQALQLRMMPQPPGVTAGHAHDVGRAGHLRGKVSRHAVGLHVMRINDVERPCRMRIGGKGRELRDKRTRHRDVALRAVDRITPVHRDGAASERRLAAPPVLRPHVHAEGRSRFFGVSDDVNLVTALRECMRGEIGPHADAALDGRILANDADPQ